MTNTNPARSTTRQVRRVFIHVAGLPEAFTSTDEAIQVLATRTGKADIRERFVSGGINFVSGSSAALEVVATATLETVQRDEQCPWLWFLTGASEFPMQVEVVGGVYELTGTTGRAYGAFLAQYRGPDSAILWADVSGVVWTGGQVSEFPVEN